jgi:hypothetical protein
MTSYVVILNGQLVQDKPLTTSLATALRDNPIAIAEGDAAAPRVKPVILHVQHKVASGTLGGTFTGGSWQTAPLQTIITNNITGASLATNQITLPAGTYDIVAASQGHTVQGHVIKLRNITDSADVLYGIPDYAENALGRVSVSRLMGRFTIAATKVLELQAYCQNTGGNSGFGNPMSITSGFEIYRDVHITKVA